MERDDLPVFYETLEQYEPQDVAAAAQETLRNCVPGYQTL